MNDLLDLLIINILKLFIYLGVSFGWLFGYFFFVAFSKNRTPVSLRRTDKAIDDFQL